MHSWLGHYWKVENSGTHFVLHYNILLLTFNKVLWMHFTALALSFDVHISNVMHFPCEKAAMLQITNSDSFDLKKSCKLKCPQFTKIWCWISWQYCANGQKKFVDIVTHNYRKLSSANNKDSPGSLGCTEWFSCPSTFLNLANDMAFLRALSPSLLTFQLLTFTFSSSNCTKKIEILSPSRTTFS